MILVARDCQSILDICDKLAEAASRLLEGGRTRLLDSPQLAGRLPAKSRDWPAVAAARLKDLPVIARIVCKDETNRTRIFYTTPAAPPPGVARANLSSIYSVFGRLTVVPLGQVFQTPKGESLVVVERALLRPRAYLEERDVADTLFESLSREPVRVKSLRAFNAAFGERRGKGAAATPAAEVPRDTLDVVVDEGEARPVRLSLGLVSPPILDALQDEVCRQPLSSRPVIVGPPGSGKTAALIRRLDFRVNREAAEVGDPGAMDRLDKLTGLPHAASWRLITPTGELKGHLREPVARLAIPGFEAGCASFAEVRLELATALGVLGEGPLSPIPHGRGAPAPAACLDTAGWYKDFTTFHLESWYRSLAARARRLSEDGEAEVAAVGRDLADLLGKASEGRGLSWFRESLAPHQETLAEIVSARSASVRGRLKASFKKAVDGDPTLLEGLVSLSPAASAGPAERFRPAAWRVWAKAVSDQALALHRGRTLHGPSAGVVAWLGEGRLPSGDRLRELGADRALIGALKRFKVDDRLFLDGYFETVVPDYLRFKRLDQLWYKPGGAAAPAKVEPLEVDLLLLALLEPAWDVIRQEDRESAQPCRCRTLARLRYLARNQILVDDASDFSPVQLKIMASLAHPSTGAVSLAADLASPATPWGLRTLDQLEWAVPRHNLVELSVNYRQSRRLAELADALAPGAGRRLTASWHGPHGAPKPVLAAKVAGPAAQAQWLADRISEIRERGAGVLPSVAVLVGERALPALAERLVRAGVPAAVLSPDRPSGRAGVVWVLTPERSRGLEFEGVLLVDPPVVPAETLYLAATRAATYLGVLLAGEIPPELEFLRGLSVDDWAQPEVPLETLDL